MRSVPDLDLAAPPSRAAAVGRARPTVASRASTGSIAAGAAPSIPASITGSPATGSPASTTASTIASPATASTATTTASSVSPISSPFSARAAVLREAVTTWFDDAARDLPWRAPDRTPWGVLVSEVMLQQTPVVRVAPVWRAWTERWPTPAALAAAPTSDVLRAWGRLGYPRRALRLQDCARAVVTDHDGEVPRDEAALRALPGVGEYTAAAVRAFAFGLRSVVVDTNVRRVLARTLSGLALPAPSYTAAERALAHAVVPADDATASRWAAASMELGAVVCTARTPDCGTCPVRDLCAWRAAGHPPDALAHRRRTQAWVGTDRQVRGRVMALLRDAAGPVDRERLLLVTDDARQAERCLGSLVEDGLVEQVAGDRFALPA